jgi:hypothetical protein
MSRAGFIALSRLYHIRDFHFRRLLVQELYAIRQVYVQDRLKHIHRIHDFDNDFNGNFPTQLKSVRAVFVIKCFTDGLRLGS